MAETRSTSETQGLLDATLEVAGGDDPEAVLHRLVDIARRLVGADHGAVVAVHSEHLVRFVHAGTDADPGRRQQGVPMRSFLEVPITVGGDVFGRLYLTEKHDEAEFSDQDDAVVRALASAAGLAIEKAGLVDEARRGRAWQRATTTITMLLLSGEDPQAVRSAITGHALHLDRAAAAAIVVPTEDPQLLRVAAGSGLLDPRSAGEVIPAEDALGQLARLAAPRSSAAVVEDLAAAPQPSGSADRALGFGPALAAALGADTGDGVLLVARSTEQQPFRSPEVDMITSFAAHAGLALALADARRKRDLVRLVEDRERIAAHLSERAMQALLEISTTVHGLTARMQSPDDAQRLTDQVDRLDCVLREMQRAIFGLQAQPEADAWRGSAAR